MSTVFVPVADVNFISGTPYVEDVERRQLFPVRGADLVTVDGMYCVRAELLRRRRKKGRRLVQFPCRIQAWVTNRKPHPNGQVRPVDLGFCTRPNLFTTSVEPGNGRLTPRQYAEALRSLPHADRILVMGSMIRRIMDAVCPNWTSTTALFFAEDGETIEEVEILPGLRTDPQAGELAA